MGDVGCLIHLPYCWGLEGMREMGLTRGGGEGG